MPANLSRRLTDSPDTHGASADEHMLPLQTPEGGPGPPLRPSRRSLRGLDLFIFFVADVQTGFGPFVSVYLTAQRWTQVDIGLVLSAAGFVSLIAQMPGGALVDTARSERLVAGIAVATICLSAFAYAALPIFPVVLSAAVGHALASCVLGPAIAAISPNVTTDKPPSKGPGMVKMRAPNLGEKPRSMDAIAATKNVKVE